ncbi:MAG TPA: OB-fold nucleic acid binding domain-containing protein [Tessaracoccus flavescens]|uniref:OB-fold nucleic acid binding domain-containing protein n=1 Tax=Tessaracoccus flavescens TaxID=399497 RepID=A0A921EQ31_9ACTN|nr:OB-fold nucleic acid binding domain-containing protein [Tessaracoccus flavescens]
MPKRSFSEKLRRFFLSSAELEQSDLRELAAETGASQLADCAPRSRVTLRGTVTSLTSDPRHGWLEAEVSDGSGTLRVIWMGRDRLECLLPGRSVLVTGRLAEDEGRPVMYNPDFEVVPG